MDLEWFFKEFLLQCAVNLFCVLVILLAIWIYVEFWMKPPHPPQVRCLYLIREAFKNYLADFVR